MIAVSLPLKGGDKKKRSNGTTEMLNTSVFHLNLGIEGAQAVLQDHSFLV